MKAFKTDSLPTRKKSVAAIIALGMMGAGVVALHPGAPALATVANQTDGIQVIQSGFADLVEQVKPAVVNISTSSTTKIRASEIPQFQFSDPRMQEFFGKKFRNGQNQSRKTRSLGSGFIIDEDGLVVTNHHVVDGAEEIEVVLDDGTRLNAEIVGGDEKTDLALLKVDHDEKLPAVKFGNDDQSRVGDWVIAIGNPFGLGGTTTTGIISARHRNINSGPFDDFIQIDAPINRGNSGGPLFNIKGEVIGVNSAIYSPTGGSVGIGFAIPASLAQNIVDDLENHGVVQRAWLGVQIQTVTQDLADGLGLEETSGALIAEIQPGSPASRSSLQPGDVIVAFDGKPVEEMRELPLIVAQSEVNAEVPVDIIRDGEPMSLNVKLDPVESEDNKVADITPEDQPKLGLTLAPVNDDVRRGLNLPSDAEGVVITDVAQDSPAADKGLRAGDIIESVDQSPVASPAEVIAQVNQARSNHEQAILLRINRGGQDRFVALRLS